MLLKVQYDEINRNLPQNLQKSNQNDVNDNVRMWFTEHHWIYQVPLDYDTDQAYQRSHNVHSKHKMIDCWFVCNLTKRLRVSKKRLSRNWNKHKQVPHPKCIWIIDQFPSLRSLLFPGKCKQHCTRRYYYRYQYLFGLKLYVTLLYSWKIDSDHDCSQVSAFVWYHSDWVWNVQKGVASCQNVDRVKYAQNDVLFKRNWVDCVLLVLGPEEGKNRAKQGWNANAQVGKFKLILLILFA